MKLYNISNPEEVISFRDSVFLNTGKSGGLFMPAAIPLFSESQIKEFSRMNFQETAFQVLSLLLQDELSSEVIQSVTESAFDFPLPLKQWSEKRFVLELFHGPTLAFKDVGARFLSQMVKVFKEDLRKRPLVLAATSGDTGGAVANAFGADPDVRVVILFPEGKVSPVQEKQLTTNGNQVFAVSIAGDFDNCQTLVKQMFQDSEVNHSHALLSANSINIARVLAQAVYYFSAYGQYLKMNNEPFFFSVPSGNLGNLTAGVFAERMGLPVKAWVASCNVNDPLPRFLNQGILEPRPGIPSLSNAMDVGNPSNLSRLIKLYDSDVVRMKEKISSWSFSDRQTLEGMKFLNEHYHYVADPHTAVAFLGMEVYQHKHASCSGIALSTAHACKFPDAVYQAIQEEAQLPEAHHSLFSKPQRVFPMGADPLELKEFLLSL